jgi:tetratricopeptide (TPR) repeat protein
MQRVDMLEEIKQLITMFALNPSDPEVSFTLGSYYEDIGQYSSAGSYYLRTAERTENRLLSYESLIRFAACTESLGRRRYSTKAILNFAISHIPDRPEAYLILSKFIEKNDTNDEKWFTAYSLVCTALAIKDLDNLKPLRFKTIFEGKYSLLLQKARTGRQSGFIEEAREILLSIAKSKNAPNHIKRDALKNLMQIKKENERANYYHNSSDLKDVYSSSLSKYVLEKGGSVHSIVVPHSVSKGVATTNASVFVDDKERIFVNLRKTNYTLYYSNKFPDQDGPLKYLYSDNDINIRSENVVCRLDDRLNVITADRVDMKLNEDPNWFYIGLEDARFIEWEGKQYLCGVRRDHILEGKGRMDLSQIEITENGVVEVERFSIPAPGNDDTYCEKNWMPVLDKPFQWVKWSNPTQIVSFDTKTLKTDTVHLEESKTYRFPRDLRGGSHILPWNDDYYIGVTHECIYSSNDSGRRYFQRIVVWDRNWNIVCSTRDFTMMGGTIEFVSGIAYHKNDVLISYGYEDNSSYILRIPREVFDDFVLRG